MIGHDDVGTLYLSVTVKDGSQPKVRRNRCGSVSIELSDTVSLSFSNEKEAIAFLESIRMNLHRSGSGGAGLT